MHPRPSLTLALAYTPPNPPPNPTVIHNFFLGKRVRKVDCGRENLGRPGVRVRYQMLGDGFGVGVRVRDQMMGLGLGFGIR